uniref:Uncharacterized protein n=1 Tax=Rhizophora mucronata TaxID=61149 RepID=A0A2P2NJR4_RHIMU
MIVPLMSLFSFSLEGIYPILVHKYAWIEHFRHQDMDIFEMLPDLVSLALFFGSFSKWKIYTEA